MIDIAKEFGSTLAYNKDTLLVLGVLCVAMGSYQFFKAYRIRKDLKKNILK